MFLMALPASFFDWTGALTRAQIRAGLKDDSVARLMGLTRQRYAQMRDGAANLSLPHLSTLAHDRDGRVMLEHFMAEWATFHGWSSLDMVMQWLRGAVGDYTQLRMRMAKAQLPARAEQKRTA